MNQLHFLSKTHPHTSPDMKIITIHTNPQLAVHFTHAIEGRGVDLVCLVVLKAPPTASCNKIT